LPQYAGVWFPHHVGHWLGSDVHDTMQVPRSKALVAGNVITVEPGVYFDASDMRVPERYSTRLCWLCRPVRRG
jgi:Xaa-Pro aminopeptidase